MPRIDVVVIGAGAVGASVAWHLARAGRRVMVLEKEPGPALHQSGRNSGVVHAGYNVKPGTAKARFCIEGNRQLRAYCAERGVPLEVGGILVVARTEPERAVLAELHQRATGNGVDVRMLDAAGIRAAEPHAAGIEALQAREAGSFDARAFVHALAGDAVRAGAEILYDTRVLRIEDASLRDPAAGSGEITLGTSKGPVTARVAVNAAGLYADTLAGALAPDMRVIPFRGYYAELAPELEPEDLVRSYAGNRAQMVDRKGQLVEDMVVRETPRAVHVLNAVSPGLTCSLPFGEHLAGLAAKKLDR